MNFRLFTLLLIVNLTTAYDTYGISERIMFYYAHYCSPNIIANGFSGQGLSLVDFKNFNDYISTLPTEQPTAQQITRFNQATNYNDRRVAIEDYANSQVNGATRIPGGPIVELKIANIASDAERTLTGTAKYTSLLESVGDKLQSTGAFYDPEKREFVEGYLESTKAAGRGRRAAFIEKNRAEIDRIMAEKSVPESRAVNQVLREQSGPPHYESHAKNIKAHGQNVNAVNSCLL
ncbi:hypothetical protein HDU92_004687 [Lobulomyces angularis]|nr:hypothetical protein HDU92_004687 [Lobulomyces angularis]